MICDVCGGKVVKKADGTGGVCQTCGVEYTNEAMKSGGQVVRMTGASGTRKKGCGYVGCILPIVLAIVVFWAGLSYGTTKTGGIIFLVCAIVMTIYILLMKPWVRWNTAKKK